MGTQDGDVPVPVRHCHRQRRDDVEGCHGHDQHQQHRHHDLLDVDRAEIALVLKGPVRVIEPGFIALHRVAKLSGGQWVLQANTQALGTRPEPLEPAGLIQVDQCQSQIVFLNPRLE